MDIYLFPTVVASASCTFLYYECVKVIMEDEKKSVITEKQSLMIDEILKEDHDLMVKLSNM